VLVFYCAGLGVTNPPVADSAASPASPTAQKQSTVTASIGGQNANVQYAGLVAGLAGLYQVTVTMPSGVVPGNAVPVTLTAAGQTSPVATIPTQSIKITLQTVPGRLAMHLAVLSSSKRAVRRQNRAMRTLLCSSTAAAARGASG
jgi:hypothetical protein